MQIAGFDAAPNSARERAELAFRRGYLHRACDLVDIGVNQNPPPRELAALLLLRARAEFALGLLGKAGLSAERALATRESAEAHGLLGTAAASLQKWSEARASYQRALRLAPASARWHAGAAAVSLELGDSTKAEEHARAALLLDTDEVDAALVMARLALRDARPADALDVLATAAERAPERADVRVTLGVALAACGHFRAGLREYEWRQRLVGWNSRRFDFPAWAGQDLRGKRLLVWSEQGLGDSLQFARFAQHARELGAFTIFHGEPRLVRLFRSCAGFDEVHSLHAKRPQADLHASLMSLPAWLQPPTERLGNSIPYLAAEPELVRSWREKLASPPGSGRMRVALVWQGNPAFCDDGQRSLALAHLFPLISARQGEIDFVSLQKGFGQDQLHYMPAGIQVRDLGAELDRGGDAFVDTAAVLANVDVLLTTDTAIAHLAGALGRPVWAMLSRVPDWRWGVQGSSTPWYPSMRLFRQTSSGDWPGVVAELSAALEGYAPPRRTE